MQLQIIILLFKCLFLHQKSSISLVCFWSFTIIWILSTFFCICVIWDCSRICTRCIWRLIYLFFILNKPYLFFFIYSRIKGEDSCPERIEIRIWKLSKNSWLSYFCCPFYCFGPCERKLSLIQVNWLLDLSIWSLFKMYILSISFV